MLTETIQVHPLQEEWRKAALDATCAVAEAGGDTLQTDYAAADAAAQLVIERLVKPLEEAVKRAGLRYLMGVEARELLWLTPDEAVLAIRNMMFLTVVGDKVMEPWGAVRNMTEQERSEIYELADKPDNIT